MKTKNLSKILVQRPRTVLLFFTIIVIAIGTQISNLHFESDFATYLPEDDSRLDLWDEINNEFHLGSTIIIIVDQSERYNDSYCSNRDYS